MKLDYVKASFGNVYVDNWDEGGVWLSISIPHGGARVVLTREQGQKLVSLVQNVLDTPLVDCSEEVFGKNN